MQGEGADNYYQNGDELGKLGTVVDDPKIKPNWETTANQGHAIERIAERGVTPEMATSWANKPDLVLSQASGQKIMYLSKDGVVVIATDTGRVMTAYSSANFDANILEILKNLKK